MKVGERPVSDGAMTMISRERTASPPPRTSRNVNVNRRHAASPITWSLRSTALAKGVPSEPEIDERQRRPAPDFEHAEAGQHRKRGRNGRVEDRAPFDDLVSRR